MTQKLSVEEIKAIAEEAIGARARATEAKAAADAAGGIDEALNTAATDAEKLAKEAEAKATALSQNTPDPDLQKKKDKLLRKKHFIERDLKTLGGDVEDDDDEDLDDDADLDDPNTPLTIGVQKRLDARKAKQTLIAIIGEVEDADEKAAIEEALKSISPTLIAQNPQQAFEAARAIANGSRNTKIIGEANRGGTGITRPRGAGSPPRHEGAFEPTAEEAQYMRAPWNLTKEQIIAARGK